MASVVSDSVQPHRWQPTRLPHPWNSLGKNTGVGCHFLLQCMKVKSESEVAQSCPVSDSLRPHGLQPTRLLCPWQFQARVLEWGAIAFSVLYTYMYIFQAFFLVSSHGEERGLRALYPLLRVQFHYGGSSHMTSSKPDYLPDSSTTKDNHIGH